MNSAIDIINIPEANTFIALDEKLQKFDLDCRHLFSGETPILEMIHKEKVTPVNTLEAIYEQVTGNGRQGLYIQRYKGLGEMNPDQLWETTMDPERRKMIKVTMADAVEAERMFVLLMGEQVSPRREYIERFAESVKDLDI